MQPALAISQLSKTYDGNFQALKGISLTVKQGDFFALLGPNGAGKSTTIGIICSLVLKTSGTVSIFGCDIDTDFSQAKQYVGVVPQEFNFNQFEKPIDILVNQAGYFGIPREIAVERAEKYLRQLGLWEKSHAPSRELSGGMKRRLMIARALIHEPKLLVLDEPTAGVDIELRRSMWDFLRQINAQGTTIILTTHYLEEAESLCRNVAIIDHGQIVKNTSIKELLQQLNKELFVLDIREEITATPEIAGYPITLVDGHTLEVEVEKSQSINQLFAVLSERGIHVLSMRNKTNRLEELFIKMVEKNLSGASHD
ncbi:MAG: ABC transporter ATP-binding protein [Porticoccaceae bacterium]|jgi:ABC-2 type transport system ATP-binding protein|nr:MAG: ABC transporter [SAR92 bacterium BACL16 MAG-120322-bin99]MDP4655437.1 ABC transporter ATP-binding protein [Alphaproteobacteria bacterium]MDP4744642.1 ABC transporter ATP-binding protein [Porticoccaceae bacterium]MDP4753860.1 ABC transporter ATP-binding protein [Porticoccaceae bacterium]MDP5051218.1 ABC transporter ATP-binding protein [Porticoccaceae bacterium]